MASAIYTQTLWQVSSTTGAGTTPAPAVPAEKLWVIRDVTLVSPTGTGFLPSCPSGVLEVNGIPILATPPGGTLCASNFRYEDLRQVVAVGDAWGFASSGVGWMIRVCGYQLTAP